MLKIFITILLLMSFSVKAMEIKVEDGHLPWQEGATLSLATAIKEAIKNNPELKTIYYNKLISESSLGMVKSDKYPLVNFDVDGGLSEEKVIHGGSQTKKSGGANLTLSYLLYDFGTLDAGVESATEALNAVGYTYNAKVMDLVFDVVDAYYYLLKTSDETKAGKINLEKTKLNYDIANERYKLGLVALNDKLQMETGYLKSELALNKAISEEKIARGKLLFLMNISPNTDLKVELPKNIADDNIIQSDILELIDRAVKSRYEIASKQAEIRYYKAEEKKAIKSDLPTISLTSSVGGDISNTNYEQKSYSGAIGLRVSVPLFTGYKSTYNIRQKREQYEQANHQLDTIISSIKESVWSAYQNYVTTKENNEVSHRLFMSAEQNERVAAGAYKAGKGTMLNLIAAQSDLIVARNERTASLYNFLIARSKLLKEIGFSEMEGL